MLGGVAVLHVLDALVLRRRREQLKALPEVPEGAARPGPNELRTLTVAGGKVDDATLAAAATEMEASGVKVVDLVPGDISAERGIWVLRQVDPERLGTGPLYPVYCPGGAHEAVAIATETAERMDIPERGESLDRGEVMRRTIAAQRHASAASVIRVAPNLKGTLISPFERWRELEEVTAFVKPHAALAPTVLVVETAALALMTAGLFVTPVTAAAALAAWSAKPALVFGGTTPGGRGLAPSDPTTESLTRLPRMWGQHIRTAFAGYFASKFARAQRRAAGPTPAPPTQAELFEDRRSTCPWCGSPSLRGLLDVPDLLQHKPVHTHLDECSDCGHVFQNPQLTVTGLNYIYDDFYGGAGSETAEWQLGDLGKAYEARVRSVKQFTEPKAWLDVGTAYGHFCAYARGELPDTTFDGLDISPNVQEGHRRGWIDTAHLGLFPEMAGSLPHYDVISMHHYLEHTKDPRAELQAAAKALEPGAHLEIEVPDPESPWGRLLGRHWYQWGQPQHLNFVICDNMIAELEKLGFDVLLVERGPTGYQGDLGVAVLLAMQSVTRSPHMPWLPPASPGDRLKRMTALSTIWPAFIAAFLADKVKDAQMARNMDNIGNGYRVVARRR